MAGKNELSALEKHIRRSTARMFREAFGIDFPDLPPIVTTGGTKLPKPKFPKVRRQTVNTESD